MNFNYPNITLLGFFIILCACGTDKPDEEKQLFRKPNIVFILTDDLGYGELGCYGQEMFRTPNLDRLAAEGMRFTDFYAGNTVCAPSRASLMTGKHPGHASVRGNFGFKDGQWLMMPLSAQDSTLGEIMKVRGYATAIFGKWHLEGDFNPTHPEDRGFDNTVRERFSAGAKAHFAEKYGTHGIVRDQNYPYLLYDGKEELLIEANKNKQGIYMDDIVLARSKQYIRNNAQRPFFLFMSLKIPHAPNTLAEADTTFLSKGWPEVERLHALRIQKMDGQIGEVTALLDSLGLSNNTVVFFTSDNGGHHEDRHDYAFFQSNGILRGYKRELYEGGIRVPLIVRWPGKVAAGQVSAHIGAQWDVLPTFVELAGSTTGYSHDGVSILPEILGKSDQPSHDYLYWEFQLNGKSWMEPMPHGGFRQALRFGKWKAVRYGLGAPTELYDLSADPTEQRSLSGEFPEMVSRAETRMEQAHENHPFFPYGGTSHFGGIQYKY